MLLLLTKEIWVKYVILQVPHNQMLLLWKEVIKYAQTLYLTLSTLFVTENVLDEDGGDPVELS